MKTPISASFQISAYSEKVAEQIANRIRETIKTLGEPSDPLVEDWTGIDQDWSPEPEVYIFFDMEEEDYLKRGIPTKIVKAIAGENVELWMGGISPRMEKNIVLKSKPPETVEQHVEWVGVSINEYQHIYTGRKVHPHAEQYKCNAPTCKKHDTWYSLPESFVELTRPECPSCSKLGQKIP